MKFFHHHQNLSKYLFTLCQFAMDDPVHRSLPCYMQAQQLSKSLTMESKPLWICIWFCIHLRQYFLNFWPSCMQTASYCVGKFCSSTFTCLMTNTVFPRIVSAETILFWIMPYVLWPLVRVHKSAETIQGRKLFAEIRYAQKSVPKWLLTKSIL